MKSPKLKLLLKLYIGLFSLLVLASIGISLNNLIHHEFDQLLSSITSCFKFTIFLLLGLNYEKIAQWLELNLYKQKG